MNWNSNIWFKDQKHAWFTKKKKKGRINTIKILTFFKNFQTYIFDPLLQPDLQKPRELTNINNKCLRVKINFEVEFKRKFLLSKTCVHEIACNVGDNHDFRVAGKPLRDKLRLHFGLGFCQSLLSSFWSYNS